MTFTEKIALSLSSSTRRLKKRTADMTKVFGIGLGKTGTKTLTWMLNILGWHTAHHLLDPMQYDKFDAVTDTPTHVYLLSTDIRYPDSKYILTVRDINSWLDSWKAWTNSHKADPAQTRSRMISYGCSQYDETKLTKIYDRHYAFIKWHFQSYGPERLLELSLCDKTIPDEKKWDSLCAFLGVPNPSIPIPQLNKRP
jgi:hypothetical protein